MGGSLFGYSNAGIVLERVDCRGTESSLSNCSTSPLGSNTVSQCMRNSIENAAGLTCTQEGT